MNAEAFPTLRDYRPTTEEFKQWVPRLASSHLRSLEEQIDYYVSRLIDSPENNENVKCALETCLVLHAAWMRQTLSLDHYLFYSPTPFPGPIYKETALI